MSDPQKRYPPELRERAVRMVFEARAADPADTGAITRISKQLGVGTESLRNWVKQDQIDTGVRPGTTTEERQRIAELEKENRELKRSNEILRRASAYFAQAELDRPWR
jgi:transposase